MILAPSKILISKNSVQKIDKMYSTFCNQPLERVRKFTERDYFFSAAEVLNLYHMKSRTLPR